MPRAGWGDVVRQLRTLLNEGALGDRSDEDLLDRYATGPGDSAEPAFAALVDRHGPMVFRVCRSVLGDEHAAEDAFQATFLVLARKARSAFPPRASLGPWLCGVAYRTACRARAARGRRRIHEARAAEQAPRQFLTPQPDDLGPVLYEEVNRLPEHYRSVVVLCYLEGLTHEQAAARLGRSVGTVRSRLATGRQKLRVRWRRSSLAKKSPARDA